MDTIEDCIREDPEDEKNLLALVEWSNRALERPPPGSTYLDTVYVAGMLLALRLQARLAASGPLSSSAIGMTLHFGVLGMAGVDPRQRPPPPEAATTWTCFGEWLGRIYLGDGYPQRQGAVRRLFADGLERHCADVSWIGNPIHTYARAASRRGGWRRILGLAYQQGAVTGRRPIDDDLYDLFEAHRMAMPEGVLTRTSGGRIMPNAGGALDSFLREARSLPGAGREPPERAVDPHEVLEAVDGARRERLVRLIQERIRAIPARSTKSCVSQLVARHRLALYRGEITPEGIAAVEGRAPSPLHREWKREQERILRDPEVKRLMQALGGPG